MFRDAVALAAKFTSPVVISSKTVGGECTSAIGTYVVVNKEGWIVTAYHIVKIYADLLADCQRVGKAKQAYVDITADPSLDHRERKKRLRGITKPKNDDVERASAWWGRDGVQLAEARFIPEADIAIGKLEPFTPDMFAEYPVFKDPSQGIEPGTSLCKLGFPFHTIIPIWDDVTQKFTLPEGALPLPRFPLDGILTRLVGLENKPGMTSPFPLEMIETSSPGLRGQSGGPTFDTQGTVWAIQSSTGHYPLGFDPPVPGDRGHRREHQFLNVGMGVHTSVLTKFFDENGLNYKLSDY